MKPRPKHPRLRGRPRTVFRVFVGVPYCDDRRGSAWCRLLMVALALEAHPDAHLVYVEAVPNEPPRMVGGIAQAWADRKRRVEGVRNRRNWAV